MQDYRVKPTHFGADPSYVIAGRMFSFAGALAHLLTTRGMGSEEGPDYLRTLAEFDSVQQAKAVSSTPAGDPRIGQRVSFNTLCGRQLGTVYGIHDIFKLLKVHSDDGGDLLVDPKADYATFHGSYLEYQAIQPDVPVASTIVDMDYGPADFAATLAAFDKNRVEKQLDINRAVRSTDPNSYPFKYAFGDDTLEWAVAMDLLQHRKFTIGEAAIYLQNLETREMLCLNQKWVVNPV